QRLERGLVPAPPAPCALRHRPHLAPLPGEEHHHFARLAQLVGAEDQGVRGDGRHGLGSAGEDGLAEARNLTQPRRLRHRRQSPGKGAYAFRYAPPPSNTISAPALRAASRTASRTMTWASGP